LWEDFDNAVRVNEDCLLLAEIENDVVILWSADIAGIFESVLRSVVESDGKGPKRASLHQILDLRNVHGEKVASGVGCGKRKMDAPPAQTESRCEWWERSAFRQDAGNIAGQGNDRQGNGSSGQRFAAIPLTIIPLTDLGWPSGKSSRANLQ